MKGLLAGALVTVFAVVAALPAGAASGRETRILLNAGVVDTASPEAQMRRSVALPATGKALRLVQYPGPIQPSWYAALEKTGARIVTYIPENAYLVWGTRDQLAAVQQLGEIQWEGAYTPTDRIDPATKVPTGAYSVQLVEDAAENPGTLSLARSLATRPAVEDRFLGYVNLRVYAEPAAVGALSARADVVSIQPWVEPKKRDERQNMIVSGNLTGTAPSGAGYLAWLASKGFTQAQFTASGFGVDVTDSGVDNGTPTPNHFGLYLGGDVTGTSRVIYNRLEGTPNAGSTIQGCDGHGNINSHIIGGFNTKTGAPYQDAQGYSYGLGVAPFVKVGSSVIFDPGTFTSPDYEDLQSRAYRDGMRVSSNSWGASTSAYTTDSQRYDALVRDAQPTASAVPVAGNQEMVILFAAGNDGSGAGTIGSPGTAKNVFTSGASENVHPFGAADQCNTADSGADSAMDIIGFSSRGPCADGRKKPDMMAPGTHVSGGVAQAAGQRAEPPAVAAGQALACFDASGVCAGPGSSNFWPLSQQWYTASSGTSHSTPAMAGGAALLRQYFINQGMNPPTPAMTKAYLMNSARYMTGVGANDNLYSNNQGMGLMDLGRAFDGTARLLDDQNPASLFTASGQTRTFSGFVAEPGKPFRVTLAWTDAPGSTAGSAWKNNLDLTVTVGGNTYLGNVFTGGNSVTGGTADGANNVESVFLPAGVTGPITVTVNATNINSDGVPGNASALDQDFSLVVYNACTDQPAAPTGVSATATAPNQVTVAFTGNGSAEYRVYRSQTAGGPYTLAATVAASPFVDATVSGGITYYYVVRARICAESPDSSEASVTATGSCNLPPTFAGLASATNGAVSTCTNLLSWAAATPACGGTISYNVYRSTASGFAPGIGTRIATGLTGTSFNDDLNLVGGTTYYYIVRAVETGSLVVEETNTVQRSAVPTGIITPGLSYTDNLDGTRPPVTPDAYWIAGNTNLQKSTCHSHSTTTAWRFGGTNGATCPGAYANSLDTRLVLGGNGGSGINGFAIPAGAVGTLSFRHAWDFNDVFSGTFFDGVALEFSTTGATGPWTKVGTAVSPTQPYITAGGYNGTITSLGTCWTGLQALTNGAFLQTTVNLDAMAGQTVWFAWHYRTDTSVTREGHYLDDVSLTVNNVAACTTNTPPSSAAVRYTVSIPSPAAAGAPVTATITALDALDQAATSYSGSADLTSSDPLATFATPVSFTAGVASPSVTFFTVGSRSLTAADTVAPSITGTGSTTVTPGAPTALAFSVQPTNAVAGVGIAPSVAVRVVDAYGNLTPSAASVTLAIGTNPGGGTLSGTLTVAAVAGVATFPGISIDKVGTGYTLAATASGLAGSTSAAFDVTPAAAAALEFGQQPTNVAADAAIAPAVTVRLLDAFGNLTTSTANVTVAIGTNPSAGTLSGTTTVAAVSGIATFSTLSINKVGVGYTLTAASGALTGATSAAFNVTHGTPAKLVFLQGPTNSAAGQAIAPAMTVAVRDVHDNLCDTATTLVTLALSSNPTGATLGGTIAVNAVAGIATFSGITVSSVGTGYAFSATSSGLVTAISVGFDVTAACSTPPTFAGLATASATGAPTCSNSLAWAAATPACSGTISYAVYRSTTPGFTPSIVNRIATGVTGTGYVDSASLVGGTAYHYVVRAVETTSAGSLEEPNTVQRSATPTAPCTTDHPAPGEAVSYEMTGLPTTIAAAIPVTVTLTARDATGQVALMYDGVAGYASSDPGASYLGALAFNAGVGTATVTFATPGSRTFTVTDVVKPSLTVTGTTLVRPVGSLVFHTLTPCRIVDTRGPAGTFGWPPIGAAGTPDRTFPLGSSGCGIPAGARAVSLNVTVVNATQAGDVLVYPAEADPAAATTVSFAAGRTRSTNTVIGLSSDGTGSVRVRNTSASAVDVVIDVNGYFAP